MRYIDSKLFKAQIFIQLLLIILVLIFDLSLVTQWIICGSLLCVVGIPHGSNDYLYRKDRSTSGLIKFLLLYIGVIAAYSLLWYYLPLLALILFFIISFHHFGQSNFENDNVWNPASVLWGICLILIPVILHSSEAIAIFKSMIGIDESHKILQRVPVAIKFWQVAIIVAIMAIYFYIIFRYERSRMLHYCVQFSLIIIWFILTPLLFGFIVVFCLWHSLQSLRHQKIYFKSITLRSPRYFFISMLPFSIIALIFSGLYLYFINFNIGVAFIILSLITLPHVFITHEQYKSD